MRPSLEVDIEGDKAMSLTCSLINSPALEMFLFPVSFLEIEGSKVSVLDFNKSASFLITQFQEWTIDNVVVPVASTYGLSEEYKYLKTSVAEFLTGREQEELAREVGFSDARHYEIAAGLMGNLVATR